MGMLEQLQALFQQQPPNSAPPDQLHPYGGRILNYTPGLAEQQQWLAQKPGVNPVTGGQTINYSPQAYYTPKYKDENYVYGRPGQNYNEQTKHYSDVGKQLGHPAYSNQAEGASPTAAPYWVGEQRYVPNPQPQVQHQDVQQLQRLMSPGTQQLPQSFSQQTGPSYYNGQTYDKPVTEPQYLQNLLMAPLEGKLIGGAFNAIRGALHPQDIQQLQRLLTPAVSNPSRLPMRINQPPRALLPETAASTVERSRNQLLNNLNNNPDLVGSGTSFGHAYELLDKYGLREQAPNLLLGDKIDWRDPRNIGMELRRIENKGFVSRFPEHSSTEKVGDVSFTKEYSKSPTARMATAAYDFVIPSAEGGRKISVEASFGKPGEVYIDDLRSSGSSGGVADISKLLKEEFSKYGITKVNYSPLADSKAGSKARVKLFNKLIHGQGGISSEHVSKY